MFLLQFPICAKEGVTPTSPALWAWARRSGTCRGRGTSRRIAAGTAPRAQPQLRNRTDGRATSHHTNCRTSQGKYFLAVFFQGIWVTVSSPATDLHLSNDDEPQQTCNLHWALAVSHSITQYQILHWTLHGNLFWTLPFSPKLLPKSFQSTTVLAHLTEEQINWCRG